MRGTVIKYLRYLIIFVCPGWLIACAPQASPSPPPLVHNREATRIVHVIRHGWHTGIIIARDDLPPGQVPETDDFPQARFFEFGWGDRDYYPALQPTPGMALAAAFASTSAAMRLRGLSQPPRAADPNIELLALSLTAAGLDRLTAEIAADFERPAGGRAPVIANDQSGASNFYPARGRFHLFNTCNTWTANKLAAAGLPVSASGVITAGDLMERLETIPARDLEQPRSP